MDRGNLLNTHTHLHPCTLLMQNELPCCSNLAVSYSQIKQALIKTLPSSVFSQIISTNSFHGNAFHPKIEIKHNLMVHFHLQNTNLASDYNKSVPQIFLSISTCYREYAFLIWFSTDWDLIISLSRQCTRACSN